MGQVLGSKKQQHMDPCPQGVFCEWGGEKEKQETYPKSQSYRMFEIAEFWERKSRAGKMCVGCPVSALR